jgi:hypothetical protein
MMTQFTQITRVLVAERQTGIFKGDKMHILISDNNLWSEIDT